jgi:hypothetical protein
MHAKQPTAQSCRCVWGSGRDRGVGRGSGDVGDSRSAHAAAISIVCSERGAPPGSVPYLAASPGPAADDAACPRRDGGRWAVIAALAKWWHGGDGWPAWMQAVRGAQLAVQLTASETRPGSASRRGLASRVFPVDSYGVKLKQTRRGAGRRHIDTELLHACTRPLLLHEGCVRPVPVDVDGFCSLPRCWLRPALSLCCCPRHEHGRPHPRARPTYYP